MLNDISYKIFNHENKLHYINQFFSIIFIENENKIVSDAEEIAPFVQEDQLFLILYKELYYRHIYARVQGGPTIEQRFDNKLYI
jgi:translation initiation factor 3 subunit L